MRWTRGLKVSAQMLWAHKLRTILSLLGIVVGVATVSVMAAVGRGSEEKVLGGIRRMGTNLISVTAGKVTVGREKRAVAHPEVEPKRCLGNCPCAAFPMECQRGPLAFTGRNLFDISGLAAKAFWRVS